MEAPVWIGVSAGTQILDAYFIRSAIGKNGYIPHRGITIQYLVHNLGRLICALRRLEKNCEGVSPCNDHIELCLPCRL
jgi:hypothetical protein